MMAKESDPFQSCAQFLKSIVNLSLELGTLLDDPKRRTDLERVKSLVSQISGCAASAEQVFFGLPGVKERLAASSTPKKAPQQLRRQLPKSKQGRRGRGGSR
jgi:hypothetical protein